MVDENVDGKREGKERQLTLAFPVFCFSKRSFRFLSGGKSPLGICYMLLYCTFLPFSLIKEMEVIDTDFFSCSFFFQPTFRPTKTYSCTVSICPTITKADIMIGGT